MNQQEILLHYLLSSEEPLVCKAILGSGNGTGDLYDTYHTFFLEKREE